MLREEHIDNIIRELFVNSVYASDTYAKSRLKEELEFLENNPISKRTLQLASHIFAIGGKQDKIEISGAISNTLVGFLMGATTLNPLPLHYVCECENVEYVSQGIEVTCTKCGKKALTRGYNLPFFVFEECLSLDCMHVFVDSGFFCKAYKHIKKNLFELDIVAVRNEKSISYIFRKKAGEKAVFIEKEYTEGAIKEQRLPGSIIITLTIKDELDRLSELEDKTGVVLDESSPLIRKKMVKKLLDLDLKGSKCFEKDIMREMVRVTGVSTYEGLQRVIALGMCTDGYLGIGKELLENKIAPFDKLPTSRDEVFERLIKELDKELAIKITRLARTGRLRFENYQAMYREMLNNSHLEGWFVEYISQIAYMPAKSLSCVYLPTDLKILYYKLNYPELF